MLNDIDLTVLVAPVMKWYQENKRDLPWRRDNDPYHIWVSEIMLQQTRVEAVKPYYARFMEALPTIADLANCKEDQLLKLWEGLGYYNRVRNMQRAAQMIVREYNGKMPETYEQILALPGIGAYTAGAIASIAYGVKEAAVDGNVLRVICRVTADTSDIAKESTKKAVRLALNKCMPEDAGAFNQGLMELGAMVCVPNKEPNCDVCPWKEMCLAKKNGQIEKIPVKTKAKARRIEKKSVLLIRDGEKVVLQKREDKGLLAGLYEFPQLEGHITAQEALDYTKRAGLMPLRIQPLENAKHIFSHIEWHMIGYEIVVADVESMQHTSGQLPIFVELSEIERNYAIPSAYKKYASVLIH